MTWPARLSWSSATCLRICGLISPLWLRIVWCFSAAAVPVRSFWWSKRAFPDLAASSPTEQRRTALGRDPCYRVTPAGIGLAADERRVHFPPFATRTPSKCSPGPLQAVKCTTFACSCCNEAQRTVRPLFPCLPLLFPASGLRLPRHSRPGSPFAPSTRAPLDTLHCLSAACERTSIHIRAPIPEIGRCLTVPSARAHYERAEEEQVEDGS